MAKNIIVSNRLPIRISKVENSFKFTATSGGLATGMKSVHEHENSLWVGWPGIGIDEIAPEAWVPLAKGLEENNYAPVLLDKEEVENFYYGLANKCLWPLFHYFIEISTFSETHWETYVEVNKKFSQSVIDKIAPGDTVWIHDYQLMLCPKMIKDARPDVNIGFFLHIPFPSFEIFRTFPCREALLEGMLGADLIGFHTYDYERHFLSSVRRILRKEVQFNRVINGFREVVVDTFPMGIDYEKFHLKAKQHLAQKENEKSELKKQLELHRKGAESGKLILSIDRLDYTKGVVNRIEAFDLFLTKYPEYLEKVRLLMLTVPSRSDVPEYAKLKKETDELVGRINGKYATVNWTPIWYYYRAMSFDDLIDLYMTSDIAMITPVRDGMNLVAKEFIASRVSGDGVLILSEMAGASKELFEAILINPFDKNAMADALLKAITMPIEEQKQRNIGMQKRLSRYTVDYWAKDFMKALQSKNEIKEEIQIPKIHNGIQQKLVQAFAKAKNKMIFLDYDGTLVAFNEKPDLAIPDTNLLSIIDTLCKLPNTDVAIVSGRDQAFLDKWFAKLPVTLVAEHGHYIKRKDAEWKGSVTGKKEWMADVLPIFETFTDRTPGTFIEEKHNSLVWHYRKTDPELAAGRVVEIKTVLSSLISDEVTILDMDKALEVVDRQVNKGSAVFEIKNQGDYDFILCIGDDVTDENMFVSLPDHAYTVKVGRKPTAAKYYIESVAQVKALLLGIVP
ncbi:MAG: bifunctional alpha,alpha-trehalose-phosphate synthase (UDP-forming)/trehalose-phosphatase [Flavobacteriaceae bacterium]|jgi:trehalose 6-phosphate synthase/phosphatase|nr:bifunctional alpha,alpha-trehalose-phosphate synthase (UDP-forming)/trehalose-phosphatase [Flavobacteriaceae bacterium]